MARTETCVRFMEVRKATAIKRIDFIQLNLLCNGLSLGVT